MTKGVWLISVTSATVCVLSAWLTGGALGGLVAGALVWAVVLVAARSTLPAPTEPARTARRQSVLSHGYPTYTEIQRKLSWSVTSPRYFEHVTRPLLRRVTSQILLERTRVELERSPSRAREILGEDVWPLVDPTPQPESDRERDSRVLTRVSALMDRLEEL